MRGRVSIAWLPLSLLLCGCDARDALEGDSIGRRAAPLSVPAGVPTLDFDVDLPDGAVALTFDDGPEYSGTTLQALDILKAEGVRATFFINTKDAIDVSTSSSARLAVQRMVAEGHQVGNHTVHHFSLGETSTDVEAEVSGVVAVLRSVAPGALIVRLVRAPYGEPYFGPQERLDVVAPIVARYGVHVGWNIDSRDWACTTATDPTGCVVGTVLKDVDAGRSGIVLLHSTKAHTVAALPTLIAELRKRGRSFTGVEELVLAKYGKPSRRLFRCVDSADCWSGDVCGLDGRCGPTAAAPLDAGTSGDTGPVDTGVVDTGVVDTGRVDTGVADSGRVDTAVVDTSVDSGLAGGTSDAGARDGGRKDTGALSGEFVTTLVAPREEAQAIDASVVDHQSNELARSSANAPLEATACAFGGSRRADHAALAGVLLAAACATARRRANGRP